jgi:hypothetical protein
MVMTTTKSYYYRGQLLKNETEMTIEEKMQEQKQYSSDIKQLTQTVRDHFRELKSCYYKHIQFHADDSDCTLYNMEMLVALAEEITYVLKIKIKRGKDYIINESTEKIGEQAQYWKDERANLEDQVEKMEDSLRKGYTPSDVEQLGNLVKRYTKYAETITSAFDYDIQLRQKLSECNQ